LLRQLFRPLHLCVPPITTKKEGFYAELSLICAIPMELESKNGSSNKILDFSVNCEKCREKSDCQSNAW
jgi:hypothetical protein